MILPNKTFQISSLKYLCLSVFLGICLLFTNSCGDGPLFPFLQRYSPPKWLLGEWANFDGTLRYNITANNLIYTSAVLGTSSFRVNFLEDAIDDIVIESIKSRTEYRVETSALGSADKNRTTVRFVKKTDKSLHYYVRNASTKKVEGPIVLKK